MNKTAIFLLAMSLLTGCATQGRVIDLNKVQQIQKGVSTEQDVINLLGNPYSKALDSEGKIIMLYVRTETRTKGATYVPVYGLFKGGTDIKQQTLSVLIGTDGKVEKYTYNDAADEIKVGF